MGVNGAGKTTFSKILAGVEQATGGQRVTGHHAKLAYYSQDHADALDTTKNVLETIEKSAKGLSASQLRTLLGCFLFKGDDVFKSVKVLSGGERARLSLANMLLTPANFLILDEPTNHLDMRSQAVLQRALAEYTGSYVIVSHNRDFLDPIVTKTLEFRVGAPPQMYAGNLSYYLDKKKEERSVSALAIPTRNSSAGMGSSKRNSDDDSQNAKERRRIEAQKRQERTRVLRPLQDKLAFVEAEIARFEEEKRGITARMGSEGFGADADEVRLLTARYAAVEGSLEKVFSQWASASEELERAEARLGAPE